MLFSINRAGGGSIARISRTERRIQAEKVFQPSVIWTPDILVITVPYAKNYPSQNTMWATRFRSGPKTVEYEALREACKRAGERLLAEGFAPLSPDIDHPTRVTLYSKGMVYPDCSNLGKAELDGIEDAGIISNDKRLAPTTYDTAPYAVGEPRVVIIIERRYVPESESRPRNNQLRGKRGQGALRSVEADQCAA